MTVQPPGYMQIRVTLVITVYQCQPQRKSSVRILFPQTANTISSVVNPQQPVYETRYLFRGCQAEQDNTISFYQQFIRKSGSAKPQRYFCFDRYLGYILLLQGKVNRFRRRKCFVFIHRNRIQHTIPGSPTSQQSAVIAHTRVHNPQLDSS